MADRLVPFRRPAQDDDRVRVEITKERAELLRQLEALRPEAERAVIDLVRYYWRTQSA